MIQFDDFFTDAQRLGLQEYEADLREALQQRFYSRKLGDWDDWWQAYEDLPATEISSFDLSRDLIRIGTKEDLRAEDRDRLEKTLQKLHPWRKGPFELFGVTIDTEWRSDWKWQRIAPHIAPLERRRVLDVGCGSGYHCWRMAAQHPRLVLGIDPSPKYLLQFMSIKKYLPDLPVHYLPIRGEDLPANMQAFDTVFSMGVLYHRRSPFDHLLELKDCLKSGGELVLETLVIEGSANEVLVPGDRYAQMRNVWFIPSCDMLSNWLARSGFTNIRVVDVSQTTIDEQRSTEWMRFQSLADFLDADNPNLTVEGYPAPIRATLIASKP